jgi:hypothetical protein
VVAAFSNQRVERKSILESSRDMKARGGREATSFTFKLESLGS